MAYTLDLRTTALYLLGQKRSLKEVSELLGVGPITLYRCRENQKQAFYPKNRKPDKVDEYAPNISVIYIKKKA